MPRGRSKEWSTEVRELVDNPVELDNPDDLYEIYIWNAAVSAFNDAELVESYLIQDRLPYLAAAVLYGSCEPREVPVGDLVMMTRREKWKDETWSDIQHKAHMRIKGPLTAIRANCFDCGDGTGSFIRSCDCTTCPAWPFRMGSNPFFGRLLDAEAVDTLDEPEEEPVTLVVEEV